MNTASIIHAAKSVGMVALMAVAIYGGYSVVGYATDTLMGVDAAVGCGITCGININMIDGPNYDTWGMYGGGGGGGGSSVTPSCTLAVAQGYNNYTLGWTTANATAISINQGIGSVTPVANGNTTVNPSVTTTYTATVTKGAQTATCSTTITITPPPTPPQCTLDLTKDNISWTTNYAHTVVIVPLTNSPQVPGATTGGGSGAAINHTETEAYESSAVRADLASAGINQATLYASGFAGDQTTMNRVCTLMDGVGATASNIITQGYDSPGNNYIVKWSGSTWTRSPASSYNSHLRYSFTCNKPGNTSTYPLNGSYNFVPPLAVGTHTYQLTATGSGQAICTKTVVVPPPHYDAPTCTLSAYPYTIEEGESTSLTWITTGATSFVIDKGVGSVTPVANGSKSVSPTVTTTYTGTATGPGGTVQCSKKITVTPPPVDCKLTIAKSVTKDDVEAGSVVEYTVEFKNIGGKKCTGSGVHVMDVLDSRLTYQSETHSTNVNAGYNSEPVYKSADRSLHWNAWDLDAGESGWVKIKAKVGSSTQAQCVENVPNKAKITAYEYNNFNTWVESNTVTVAASKDCQIPKPVCTLTASPYTIDQGETSTLSWTTTNGTTFSIDNGVGSVTPVAAGTKVVSPSVTTTYVGTVTGPGGTAQCTKKVTVTPPPQGECKMVIEKSVNKTNVAPGEEVEYTVEFKNIGGKNCTGGGVKVVDVLDADLTYKSETHSNNVTGGYGSDPVYKSSDRTLRWNADTLTPGESGWVKFKAKAATPTACSEVIPNKAKITSYEYNNFKNWVESDVVNVTVTKDCHVPAPYCTLSANPTTIDPGQSSTLSWNSTNVTSVVIDQGVGSVGTSGNRSVSPNTTTTYTGTFTGPGGTITCSTVITVTPPPGPACTLTVSASKIKPGASVFVSWTSTNAVSGFISGGVGTTSPVSNGTYEIFPSDDITYVGTFKASNGQTITCQAPVTLEKGGGGCVGNCGGGLNQPNVVLMQKPGDAPLAFVSLSQIPYTGFDAGLELTILFWTAVGLLAALVAYFVMGKGGVQFLLGNALQFAGVQTYSRDYDDARTMPRTVQPETEYVASTLAAAPMYAVAPQVMPVAPVKKAEDGIPELADVIESRAHGAGVLMSPEAVQMALSLSSERGQILQRFGDVLNEAVKTIPREDGWILLTSERFDEIAGKTPAVAPTASISHTPSVESILASVMAAPAMPAERTVEMPMSSADDQAVVMSLARAILKGNRDGAYQVARTLEMNGANGSTVMTIVATALDQLHRARRHGTTTDLTTDAVGISDEALAKVVEAFAHGMDHGYANAFTGLKLAIAQAFEARG